MASDRCAGRPAERTCSVRQRPLCPCPSRIFGDEGAVHAAVGSLERLTGAVELGFCVAAVLDRDCACLNDVVDIIWVVVPSPVFSASRSLNGALALAHRADRKCLD
jgi:hypothetical protein